MDEIGIKISVEGDEARESLAAIDAQLEKMSAQAARTVASMGQQFAKATGEVCGMEAAFKKYQRVLTAFDEVKKGTKSLKEFNETASGTGIALDESGESMQNAEKAIAAYGEGALKGILEYERGLQNMLPALWAVEANSQIEGSISGDASALIEAIMAAIGWIDILKQDAEMAGVSLNSGGGRASGGGSKKASWYKEQIKDLEHLKALNQLSYEAEIQYLERIAAVRGKLSKADAQDLDERLYAAREDSRRAAIQSDYDALQNKKAMGQMSLETEVVYLAQMRDMHAFNTDELLALDEKLYAAREALRQANLRAEYDAIAHEKAMGRMGLDAELQALEQILTAHELSAEELRDLNERLFEAREEIRRRDIDAEYALLNHEKQMGRLSYLQEAEWLERIAQRNEMSAEEKRRIEEEIFQAREYFRQETLRLDYQNIDHQKRMGQLSLEQERALLQEIKALRELNAEELLDITQRLYDSEAAIKSRDAKSLNTLLSGVGKALSARYKEMEQEETALLTASKQNWTDWAKGNTDEITAQIAALDALLNQTEKKSADEKEQKKLAALEQAVMFEKDAFNRAQMQAQLDEMLLKRQNRLLKEDIENQKAALKSQMAADNAQAASEQQMIDGMLNSIKENYRERLNALNIEAEAERLLMQGNQDAIIALMAAYAPEYNQTGITLGESLLKGFDEAVASVAEWIDALSGKMAQQQAQIKAMALDEADAFYAGKQGQTVTVNQQIHFNQPVESPYEAAERLRRANEELARSL